MIVCISHLGHVSGQDVVTLSSQETISSNILKSTRCYHFGALTEVRIHIAHLLITAQRSIISFVFLMGLDCSDNFRTPRQLIKHKRNDHGSDAVLRSTAQPSTVSMKSIPLPPHVPKILPWYMFEYRVVRPASIPKQRHENFMASVSFFPSNFILIGDRWGLAN